MVKAGVHKSSCARSACRLTSVWWHQLFGFLSVELASCHSYGASGFEVAAGFLVNLFIPVLRYRN